MALATSPDRKEMTMRREPIQSYEDRPEEAHARGKRPRAIDARRRTTAIGAMIAAILLIVVLVLVL